MAFDCDTEEAVLKLESIFALFLYRHSGLMINPQCLVQQIHPKRWDIGYSIVFFGRGSCQGTGGGAHSHNLRATPRHGIERNKRMRVQIISFGENVIENSSCEFFDMLECCVVNLASVSKRSTSMHQTLLADFFDIFVHLVNTRAGKDIVELIPVRGVRSFFLKHIFASGPYSSTTSQISAICFLG